MAKQINLPSITNKIYELLKDLSSEDRQKIIKAAFTLLGEGLLEMNNLADTGIPLDEKQSIKKTKDFFEKKDPQSKMEEIAVACKFREDTLNLHTHTKEEINKVFVEARRNFDSDHFKRDLDNAKSKGLITKGKEIKLSYIGQKYVDALPNREEIKKLGKSRGRKSSSKKKKGK